MQVFRRCVIYQLFLISKLSFIDLLNYFFKLRTLVWISCKLLSISLEFYRQVLTVLKLWLPKRYALKLFQLLSTKWFKINQTSRVFLVVCPLIHVRNKQLLSLSLLSVYSTCAIITRSWFETALDYKPRILGPTFLVYVLKWSVILTSLALKNGVKNIQTAGYNGARTVYVNARLLIQNFHNSFYYILHISYLSPSLCKHFYLETMCKCKHFDEAVYG